MAVSRRRKNRGKGAGAKARRAKARAHNEKIRAGIRGEHRCKLCGCPVAPGNALCGECACEDDSSIW